MIHFKVIKMTIRKQNKHSLNLKKTLLASLIAMNVTSVSAQSEQEQLTEDDQIEVIEVSGLRDSYKNAISTKRAAVTIVDSISLEDMGALPDNSVAETLERITGVAADRFKGGASEISIRGLGPFLGMSTLNGRAISSGSGNRSVAFSQFPSELVNGVKVYKSQSANLLEGGVSGVIDLGTIKPVDYGKENFQAEVKGTYDEYQSKLEDDNGFGNKISFSYTNTYDVGDGQLGFAIGYAGGESPRPEETYLTSSTLRNCNSDYGLDGGSSCSFKDSNAAANGGDAIDGDYYFISNAFTYRQMESVEDDDAVIAAVQWKPTDKLDINFDAQWSESSYFEDRHDLSFDDARRRVSNWQTNDEHILTSYTGESRIANMNEMRTRDEEYKGAGFNVKWQVTDDLELAFDAAYSGTNRWQDRTYTRFRSKRKFYDWQQRNSQQFPDVTNVYTDFDDAAGSSINWQSDVNDLAFFDDDSEARKYRFEIDDRIRSTKLDAKYLLDAGMFTFLSSGFAYSSRSHQNYGEDQVSKATAKDDRAGVLSSAASCLESWPQSGYGEDGDSPVSQWAYLDTSCAYSTLVGSDVLSPDPKAPSEADIDLTEEITSFYVMSDFESELGGMYVRGNVGVRYVHTNIESKGVTQSYTVQTNENGFIELDGNNSVEINHFENSFSNVLPSLNVILELREDTELRFAAFKAISRPDMWFYGAGREVSDITYDDGYTTPEQALDDGNVSARGNPNLELIKSNNYELGLNWYLEDETMLSASYYYKTFSARFGADTSDEQIVVDGTSYDTTVQGVPTIYDDESSIQGVEFTAVHRFKTLPEPFDGLGLSLSYNYSDSDYITPEAGGSITEDARAEVTPANLAGLSEHVANTQVYWEGEAASIRLSYKYRSDYLKPFGNDLSQTNRFVDDQKTVDLSLGYKLTEQLTAKFEVLNLTNEPAVQQRVAQGAYNQIEYSGSKVFFGIKYKM